MKTRALTILTLMGCGWLPATAAPAEGAANSFAHTVSPLLEKYCTDCHGPERQKAKLNLAGPRAETELLASEEQWYRVLDQLEAGKMPPKDEDQPTPAEREKLTGWLREDFTNLVLARQRTEGRSRLRRLTRAEYANTLEDLFGVRPAVEVELPPDGLTDGFDKVSTALPLSADGARGYLKLAEEALKWVLRPAPKPADPTATELENRTTHAPAVESGESKGHSLVLEDGTIVSFNSDNSSGRLKFPGVKTPGWHHLRLSVFGYQTDRPLPFGIYVGKTGAYPQEIDLAQILEAPPGQAQVLETDLYLKEGSGLRLIPFGLGVPVPKNSQASECRKPGLAVQWVETVAPAWPLPSEPFLTADFSPALREEMRRKQTCFSANPKKPYQAKSVTREEFRAIMAKTFARVGGRLYRRELTPEEVASYTDIIRRQTEEEEVPLNTAFFAQLAEMLTSPDFLCLVEQPGPLTDFALATRLSYFLWNSGPDEALLALAREGKLHQPKVLDEQTERLLQDRKSERFIADFADQWLGLRAIADTSPDRKLYPGYDELLRFSSVRETRAFLQRLVAENGGARDLVAARWSFLNQPLAAHYGLPGLAGLDLRMVTLPDPSPYGGLWTQASILKVTANGTNTSPVKRGVWVAERLLGMHIPPPPPNINPVQPDIRGAKTLREQLALHRANASCAACHAQFDPYGFALESFDVVGGYRTHYRVPDTDAGAPAAEPRPKGRTWRDGLPVDCTGQTPDGRDFADIGELRRLLAANPRQLAAGFTTHLVTYATGTPPGGADRKAIAAILDESAKSDYGLRTLIHRLIQSPIFRNK